MKYDLVIFDLDGTTLNTLEDLAGACNATLRANGYPTHSIEKIRTSVGSGVANLIRLTLPADTDSAIHAKVLADFKTYYSEHVNVKTAPYPGILSMMQALRSAGIRIAVNSNKYDGAVQSLCASHFGDLVDMAVGECANVPRKPDPAGVHQIIHALNADLSRTLYVGDSNIDVLTAQNAGLDCAWVSWGFRNRDEMTDVQIDHAFDSVEALTEFILN